MRKAGLLIVLALVLVVSGNAWADHVIHFKNGTSMPIRAYRMEDGMVHVDLGGNAFMAFPEALIDEIENPNRSLNLKPSNVSPDSRGSMRAASGRNGGGRAGGASGGPAGSKSQYQPADRYNTGIVTDPTKPGYQPTQGAYQSIGTGGAPSNVSGNGELRGATRVGNRYQLPGKGVTGKDRRVDVQMRDPGSGGFTPPPGFNPPNSGAEPPKPKDTGSDK